MRHDPRLCWLDVIGHGAIREVMPEACGVNREDLLRIPPVIARAIKAGKMKKMIQAGDYRELHYDAQGRLHKLKGPARVSIDGYKDYYLHGKEYYSQKALNEAVKKIRDARK